MCYKQLTCFVSARILHISEPTRAFKDFIIMKSSAIYVKQWGGTSASPENKFRPWLRPYRHFLHFDPSIHVNSGTVPRIKPPSFPYTSFQIQYALITLRNRGNAMCIAGRLRAKRPGIRIPEEIFLSPKRPDGFWGPIKPPIHWVPTFFPRNKADGAWRSPSTSTKSTGLRLSGDTPLLHLHLMSEDMENFTFFSSTNNIWKHRDDQVLSRNVLLTTETGHAWDVNRNSNIRCFPKIPPIS